MPVVFDQDVRAQDWVLQGEVDNREWVEASNLDDLGDPCSLELRFFMLQNWWYLLDRDYVLCTSTWTPFEWMGKLSKCEGRVVAGTKWKVILIIWMNLFPWLQQSAIPYLYEDWVPDITEGVVTLTDEWDGSVTLLIVWNHYLQSRPSREQFSSRSWDNYYEFIKL